MVEVDGHPTWVRSPGISNVQRDDYVLVYAGYAVQQISRAEAEELLAFYATLEIVP
jgi:hydrogenase maturation factor